MASIVADDAARRRIRVFVFWLVVVTLTTEGLIACAFTCHWGGALWFMAFELAVSWSPGMAALLASLQCGRPIAAIGWRRPSWRMVALAYAIPLAYSMAAYGTVWATGLGRFPNPNALERMTSALGLTHLSLPWALMALLLHHGTHLWLRGCCTSLGEEIGWRGFLLPELMQSMSYRRASVITGLVWSVWHLPLILFGGYHGHTHMGYSVVCFTLVITAMSFPLSWLRVNSGEVWTCTAFHASHNLFLLKLLNPLTEDTGLTRWLVSEFGAVTVIMTLATAWCFRSRDSFASSGSMRR